MGPIRELQVPLLADKAAFLKQAELFWDDCKNNSAGLNIRDLWCVVQSITSPRMRVEDDLRASRLFDNLDLRREVLENVIHRLIHEFDVTGRINQDQSRIIKSYAIWALLHLISRENVREINQSLLDNNILPPFFIEAERVAMQCRHTLKIFFGLKMSKAESDPAQNTGIVPVSSSSRKSRDTAVKDCLVRDQGKCVVTGHPVAEVCHIYPFSGLEHPFAGSAFEAMAYVHGRERAAKLRQKSKDQDVVDGLGNLICMSPNMHTDWGKAKFALKPLKIGSEHGRSYIDMALHWMVPVVPRWFRPDTENPTFMTDATVLMLSREISNGTSYPTEAWNLLHNIPITNGHIVRVSVAAGNEKDLPDFDILQLQYDVIRMANLCGGAELQEEEEDDNDEVDGGASSAIGTSA